MTGMIKCLHIYNDVQSCGTMSSTIELSDYFDVTIRLKQGEPLSPLFLFHLLITSLKKTRIFPSLIKRVKLTHNRNCRSQKTQPPHSQKI